MELRYIENISSDNQEATMRLIGRIGNLYNSKGELIAKGINGEEFGAEMRYLSNLYPSVKIRINSEGGSVLQGYDIIDAMNECKESGTIIKTHNVGMAASMASVVLCNGTKGYRTATNYSTTMIHEANGEEKGSPVINAINQSIRTIYNDCTKLNGDVAAELMGKETFMSASDACDKYGFIDEVISTNTNVKLPKKKSIENLAIIYNQLLTPKTMDKVTALLGLKNEASEDVIVESIESLKKDLETEKTEKAKLEARLAELEEAAKKAKEAEEAKKEADVTAKVENAISKGLAKADKKDELIELGKTNMSMLDLVIESATKASKATAVAPIGMGKASEGGDDRSNWTIIDWQKKDEKGLAEIQNTTPEVYQQMFDNYYKLGIGNPKFKNK